MCCYLATMLPFLGNIILDDDVSSEFGSWDGGRGLSCHRGLVSTNLLISLIPIVTCIAWFRSKHGEHVGWGSMQEALHSDQ